MERGWEWAIQDLMRGIGSKVASMVEVEADPWPTLDSRGKMEGPWPTLVTSISRGVAGVDQVLRT